MGKPITHDAAAPSRPPHWLLHVGCRAASSYQVVGSAFQFQKNMGPKKMQTVRRALQGSPLGETPTSLNHRATQRQEGSRMLAFLWLVSFHSSVTFSCLSAWHLFYLDPRTISFFFFDIGLGENHSGHLSVKPTGPAL